MEGAVGTKRLIEEMLLMQAQSAQASANATGGVAAQPMRAPYPGGQPLQMANMLNAPSPGVGAPGAAAGARPAAGTDVHHDIARDIGQQVEIMILNAKRSSEQKVSQELGRVKTKIESMAEKIRLITERVNRLDPANGVIQKADLQKSIAKLEEVWEGEVGTLKHELWQTIQAHNHNADLMKHHKDAIDIIQEQTSEQGPPNAELEQIHGQLLQLDKVMQREQAKQQQIDQFMQRLTMVQNQLSAGLTGWNAGLPFQMPPVPQDGMLNQGPGGGKKTQRKGAKAGKAPKAASAASNQAAAPMLRAEAPEFVPFGCGDS